MARVVVFHHAQGLTEGVLAFADGLRTKGHEVVTPDLYDGLTFDNLADGVTHAESIGMTTLVDAGTASVSEISGGAVYAGFSLGGLVAHKLAQTDPEAMGALLYHYGDVPPTMFAPTWPEGTDVQLHISEEDEYYEPDTVDDFVRVVDLSSDAELFTYPGSAHLFTDSSIPDYDPDATRQVLERSLVFLARLI